MLSARGQLASARANINMLSARGLPNPPAAAPPPPAPALDIGFQAASSHAALTRLLALQSELDASAVENVRLGAALSESRVECHTLRADLALAERAADGRWRAAGKVVWRWRVRTELQKAHMQAAAELVRREVQLRQREEESARLLGSLADASQAVEHELSTSLASLRGEASLATAQLSDARDAAAVMEGILGHEREERGRLTGLAASAQSMVLQLLQHAADAPPGSATPASALKPASLKPASLKPASASAPLPGGASAACWSSYDGAALADPSAAIVGSGEGEGGGGDGDGGEGDGGGGEGDGGSGEGEGGGGEGEGGGGEGDGGGGEGDGGGHVIMLGESAMSLVTSGEMPVPTATGKPKVKD